MTSFKLTNRFADRGKKAESAVAKYLQAWAHEQPLREFNRLVDSKAAGRTIKASAADFDFYRKDSPAGPVHGLVETKETQHDYRLGRDKLTQLPRLRKRENCGGRCFVLVYHSTTGLWRVLGVHYLTSTGDKGSWNLSDQPTYPTVAAAMASTGVLEL